MLYYMTEEAQEGGKAFLEKRKPRFGLRRVMRKDEVFIRLRVEKRDLIRPEAERAV